VNKEVDVRQESGDDENPYILFQHITESVYLSPRDSYHSKEYSAKSHRRFGNKTWQERAEYCTDISSINMQWTTKHPQTEDIAC
jgi:hypothetical protein